MIINQTDIDFLIIHSVHYQSKVNEDDDLLESKVNKDDDPEPSSSREEPDDDTMPWKNNTLQQYKVSTYSLNVNFINLNLFVVHKKITIRLISTRESWTARNV